MKKAGRTVLLYARDVLAALAVGGGTGIATGLVLFGLGTAAGGVLKGLSLARSGLMIAGALVLITGAIQFLKGGNLPADTFRLPTLKKDRGPGIDDPAGDPDTDLPRRALPIFRILSRRVSLVTIGAGILLVSAIPDLILFSYRQP